jgi:hypothetical protein
MGYIARIIDDRSACKVLIAEQKIKSPLRRPKHRWKDNFKMDEVG